MKERGRKGGTGRWKDRPMSSWLRNINFQSDWHVMEGTKKEGWADERKCGRKGRFRRTGGRKEGRRVYKAGRQVGRKEGYKRKEGRL
jgi:hypothetical protein